MEQPRIYEVKYRLVRTNELVEVLGYQLGEDDLSVSFSNTLDNGKTAKRRLNKFNLLKERIIKKSPLERGEEVSGLKVFAPYEVTLNVDFAKTFPSIQGKNSEEGLDSVYAGYFIATTIRGKTMKFFQFSNVKPSANYSPRIMIKRTTSLAEVLNIQAFQEDSFDALSLLREE
jgi:hypothetical protein